MQFFVFAALRFVDAMSNPQALHNTLTHCLFRRSKFRWAKGTMAKELAADGTFSGGHQISWQGDDEKAREEALIEATFSHGPYKFFDEESRERALEDVRASFGQYNCMVGGRG